MIEVTLNKLDLLVGREGGSGYSQHASWCGWVLDTYIDRDCWRDGWWMSVIMMVSSNGADTVRC